MIDIAAASKDVQEEILKLVRTSQETAIDALQAWAAAVQSLTPDFAKVKLPYANQLPKPEALVSGTYDFAEQLLSAQRKFADEVIKAAQPLIGQVKAA